LLVQSQIATIQTSEEQIPGKSDYVREFMDSWAEVIETSKKKPLSPDAIKKLKAFAKQDVHNTIDELAESGRTWAKDEPTWRAWAQWYPTWARAEAERVIPDIVHVCALDREERHREIDRASRARQGRVVLAQKIVSELNTLVTKDQLEARLYPPNQGKGKRACRKMVEFLIGLGVLGEQKGRDGVMRLALWRSLWPEDLDAVAWATGEQTSTVSA
jgi:hypothetical protein